MAATVEAAHLTKAHQIGDEQVYAVNDFPIAVQPGEMVGIVGGPASGKSTLLHILGCLQLPDSGSLKIEGQDVTQLDDQELATLLTQKVGFVFQAFNLLPNETVYSNVEIPLRSQKLSEEETRAKVEIALQTVGLGAHLEDKPGRISARQRQCVAIARALVNDPTVIFADEPTRAMDSKSQQELMTVFKQMASKGRSVVIATSDPEIGNQCNRVVGIANGKSLEKPADAPTPVVPKAELSSDTPSIQAGEEALVCPRCSHGNPESEELCQSCKFPLRLTQEEERSIEGRLSGVESRYLGVESTSDDADVPKGGLIDDLKDVPFLAGLGAKNLIKVIPALELRRFSGGSTIVKQGDEGDAFYIVGRGNVRVVLERPGRPDSTIAELGPKECFGEMALLTDQPRAATVTALTDAEVWRLPSDIFEKLLEENLSLTVYFNRIMSQRLTELQNI